VAEAVVMDRMRECAELTEEGVQETEQRITDEIAYAVESAEQAEEPVEHLLHHVTSTPSGVMNRP
jgi:pyruvate dehydrogenase E1 component alpha subunit